MVLVVVVLGAGAAVVVVVLGAGCGAGAGAGAAVVDVVDGLELGAGWGAGAGSLDDGGGDAGCDAFGLGGGWVAGVAWMEVLAEGSTGPAAGGADGAGMGPVAAGAEGPAAGCPGATCTWTPPISGGAARVGTVGAAAAAAAGGATAAVAGAGWVAQPVLAAVVYRGAVAATGPLATDVGTKEPTRPSCLGTVKPSSPAVAPTARDPERERRATPPATAKAFLCSIAAPRLA
ncbi:MAG TPA: hypothetical protein VKI19_05605 [Acidimicrobiales bacterium]|nr:hypothetical protein [Acidimicrobiales bacterium]